MRPSVSVAVPVRAVWVLMGHTTNLMARGVGATVCWTFWWYLPLPPHVVHVVRPSPQPYQATAPTPTKDVGRDPRGIVMWTHGSFLRIFSEASFFTSEMEGTCWARQKGERGAQGRQG